MAYARLSVRKGIDTNAELRIYYYALAIRKLEKERIKKKKNQLNGFPKLKSKREVVAEEHKHVEYKRERKSKM